MLCLPTLLWVSFTKIVSFSTWARRRSFHAAGAQCDLAVPSSALLVSPTSSPYLDANAEIGLRVTESPDCLTLQLHKTNQMWGGEPPELLVAKGY